MATDCEIMEAVDRLNVDGRTNTFGASIDGDKFTLVRMIGKDGHGTVLQGPVEEMRLLSAELLDGFLRRRYGTGRRE